MHYENFLIKGKKFAFIPGEVVTGVALAHDKYH
jgi:hypothetical protein